MRRVSSPVAVSAACAVLAVLLSIAVVGRDPVSPSALADRPPTAKIVPTRPPTIGLAEVTRFARALGITGEPVADAESWRASDPQRSVVLQLGPESWSVVYTDSSVLLEPPAPETGLPRSVSEPAPGAGEASVAARAVLHQAGVLPGRWVSFTGAAAETPAVCRPLPTRYDCNQIHLRARRVVFVRTVRGRPTTIQWEVLVGPGTRILDAVGRIATIGRSR